MARQKVRIQNVGWREHPTRRYGVKKDRRFYIRHTVNGKELVEYVGWASEDWTIDKVIVLKNEIFENKRKGEGPQTLREKRELEEAKRQEELAQKERRKRDRTTFAMVWPAYIEQARADKLEGTCYREEQLYLRWVKPVIGHIPMKKIAPIQLERIKKDMAEATPWEKRKKKSAKTSKAGSKGKGLAPRTITYALALVRQVFNFARNHGLFEGENPVSRVKKPSEDNRRLRFLSREEAGRLLELLAIRSRDVYDMTLLALHCGLRAGEIFSLTWQDVDLDNGRLTLRDTKNTKTRMAFMTSAVSRMLQTRAIGVTEPQALVFPGRGGQKITQISDTYNRTVNELGLNTGITDRRMRVTFHTLRHTYASWLVENGTDLYTVKELLGHADFKMTSRYAHLGQNTLQEAVSRLDRTMKPAGVVDIGEYRSGASETG